jgi:hypothetical protein
MLEMAGLDNPNGSPFMAGEKQREWLKAGLAKVSKSTPVVVLSHSPLQKLYKGSNFRTEDVEEVQAMLAPFDQVNVIYGYVRQMQYNQIGNIAFNSVMATPWPWPDPQSHAQAEHSMPKLTVPMNRADPFFGCDATGWQVIDVLSNRTRFAYNLYDSRTRTPAFDRGRAAIRSSPGTAGRSCRRPRSPTSSPRGTSSAGSCSTRWSCSRDVRCVPATRTSAATRWPARSATGTRPTRIRRPTPSSRSTSAG